MFGIDEGKRLSSFYREFESAEDLRKEFTNYTNKKIGRDDMDVDLDVDETEYALYPLNRYV